MASTTAPAPLTTSAALAQSGDVVTGIPNLLAGQLARIVEVQPVLRDIRLTPQVVLHVALSGQQGVWEFRVDADTELTLVEAAGDLSMRLNTLLAEMAG